MKVPILEFKSQYRAHQAELDAAIREVLEASSFILGEQGKAFEREFADYCGAEHAVGVGSGTEALHLALLACGVGSGDEGGSLGVGSEGVGVGSGFGFGPEASSTTVGTSTRSNASLSSAEPSVRRLREVFATKRNFFTSGWKPPATP